MAAEKPNTPRGALRPRSAVKPARAKAAAFIDDADPAAAMLEVMGEPPITPETIAERDERHRAVVFPSANRRKGEVPLSDDFERIVLSYQVDEPFKVYQQLERELELGDQRNDHASVRRALDRVESNARLAHRLWMTARIEERRWELENEVTHAAMRSAATIELQREKTAGDRNKAITDADVTHRACTMFPDEYRAQEVRKKKVEGMTKSCENLSVLWNSRCAAARQLHSQQR